MKKLFVWDFHGTLETGNDGAVIEITNRVLEESGFIHRMTTCDAEVLTGKRWHEYFLHLLPDEDPDLCMKLQAACISIFQRHPEIVAKYIRPTPFAYEILE